MTDAYGRDIPGDDETPDLPKAFEDFSLSMPPGPLPVSSIAQANAIRAAAGNPSTMHVWNTATNQELRWNGSGWEYVAGRQHGATINFSRTGVPANPSSPLVLYATSFVRASPGWTMSSAQNLVIPETGMYVMYVDINMSGSASTAGRTFFQFSTTNGVFGARHTVTNENNFGGTAIWPLTKGNEMRIQVYHEGGGARDYTATLQIAMINAPNW